MLTRPLERIAYASDASFYRLIPQAVVQPVDRNHADSGGARGDAVVDIPADCAGHCCGMPFGSKGYATANLTCEMGMRLATSKPHCSILYLVERSTRARSDKEVQDETQN